MCRTACHIFFFIFETAAHAIEYIVVRARVIVRISRNVVFSLRHDGYYWRKRKRNKQGDKSTE
ncbi:hypothetical protein BBC27_05220 [Acidithiobacillus ferrivorans]|uniref:Uncharacterized protein n=1 Tax=Acidithiobacillus ferrivorans TaxID=160808 RepID=A0A1B9C203_9PROT|nr:hypothetical protein BBC27_05220 [Acidithiobacillus ferrivorans]